MYNQRNYYNRFELHFFTVLTDNRMYNREYNNRVEYNSHHLLSYYTLHLNTCRLVKI